MSAAVLDLGLEELQVYVEKVVEGETGLVSLQATSVCVHADDLEITPVLQESRSVTIRAANWLVCNSQTYWFSHERALDFLVWYGGQVTKVLTEIPWAQAILDDIGEVMGELIDDPTWTLVISTAPRLPSKG